MLKIPNLVGLFIALFMLAGCVKPVEVVTALPEAKRGAVEVTSVNVNMSEDVLERMAKFDEKAARQRQQQNLPVWTADMPKPDEDVYETLPFKAMFPFLVMDVLAENGISGAEKVSLDVQIDTLKTANGAMMMLLGDSDQLSGLVKVRDARTNAEIAEFYVDTINSRGGLMGIALRGGSVREKLTAEFAGHIAKQLRAEKE